MLDRIPRPVRILAILAILAFGCAMLANFGFAKLLRVDPARLAEIRSGLKAPSPAAVAEAEANEGPKAKTPKRAAGPKRLDYFQRPIVERHIFNSAANPLEVVEEPEPGEDLIPSEIDAVLVATSVASPAMWSTALLAVQSGPPELFRIGEKVLEAEIVEIYGPWLDRNGNHHAARIIVKRNQQREYLEVGEAKRKTGGRKVASADKEDAKPARPAVPGRHDYAIKECGDNRFCVPQGDIDYALANLDKMAREARVVPNFADGQTNGFKVFSIRRNSALRQMGLKNNDVLTGVNGFDLSNTEKALEIYSKLQNEKSFTLELLRNGKPMTMEYSVE
jgi:general secretion pathway protein C